jgi:molybdopterin adenylyltransferase
MQLHDARGKRLYLTAEKRTSALQSCADAAVAGGTYFFCLAGSPGACRDSWDEILRFQLDIRHRPCNFAELIPRLREHEA